MLCSAQGLVIRNRPKAPNSVRPLYMGCETGNMVMDASETASTD